MFFLHIKEISREKEVILGIPSPISRRGIQGEVTRQQMPPHINTQFNPF